MSMRQYGMFKENIVSKSIYLF